MDEELSVDLVHSRWERTESIEYVIGDAQSNLRRRSERFRKMSNGELDVPWGNCQLLLVRILPQATEPATNQLPYLDESSSVTSTSNLPFSEAFLSLTSSPPSLTNTSVGKGR